MNPSRLHLPSGHVILPVAAIGSLSMALAAGLAWIGVLEHLDMWIARMVSGDGAGTFPKSLPDLWVWSATALCAFGIAAAILGTPGHLRRGLLWASALLVVAAWAPVLSLAARSPDIAAPCVVTIWSGICALVYASRHDMPADHPDAGAKDEKPAGS